MLLQDGVFHQQMEVRSDNKDNINYFAKKVVATIALNHRFPTFTKSPPPLEEEKNPTPLRNIKHVKMLCQNFTFL